MQRILNEALVWHELKKKFFDSESRKKCIAALKSVPDADAVPVVRCKDCKYFYSECCLKTGFCVDDDYFCADGETKEGEKDV